MRPESDVCIWLMYASDRLSAYIHIHKYIYTRETVCPVHHLLLLLLHVCPAHHLLLLLRVCPVHHLLLLLRPEVSRAQARMHARMLKRAQVPRAQNVCTHARVRVWLWRRHGADLGGAGAVRLEGARSGWCVALASNLHA